MKNSHLQTRGGDPRSEPLMEAKEEDVSSLDMATNLSGAGENLLFSRKKEFWRPEYERGVKSSGVALPRELRRGAGVIDPFRYPFPRRFPFADLLFMLPTRFGLPFNLLFDSFSAIRSPTSFFCSWYIRISKFSAKKKIEMMKKKITIRL